jgi:hypothetical protein
VETINKRMMSQIGELEKTIGEKEGMIKELRSDNMQLGS